MENLFTYGTLIFPEIMTAVTGRTFRSVESSIDDYKAYKVRGQVFPGAVSSAGDSLSGRVYFDLDPVSSQILDIFEGDLYDRINIDLIQDTERVPVSIYRFRKQSSLELEDNDWSADYFYQHHYMDYLQRCKKFHDNVSRILKPES